MFYGALGVTRRVHPHSLIPSLPSLWEAGQQNEYGTLESAHSGYKSQLFQLLHFG